MASESPLVSVIIPTFNRGSVLCGTLEDVFRQTYEHIEVIVVDDASTDLTETQIRPYRDRIRYVRLTENVGPAGARNRGVEVAKGEFVAFQDSDDLWDAHKLSRQVRLIESAGESGSCSVCNAILDLWRGQRRLSFDVSWMHPSCGDGFWLNPLEVLATRPVLFNQAALMRRSALCQIGGYDESMRYLEDWDLALRLAGIGKWTFTAEPLATWRANSDFSLTGNCRRNPAAIYEGALGILCRAVSRVSHGEGDGPVGVLLQNTAAEYRRRLRLCHRQDDGSAISRGVAMAENYCERLRQAVYRRSPAYPRMVTRPLPA